jgi:hypothetical protein
MYVRSKFPFVQAAAAIFLCYTYITVTHYITRFDYRKEGICISKSLVKILLILQKGNNE